LRQKRQFFRWFFRRKYLKNHNIGPRACACPWIIVCKIRPKQSYIGLLWMTKVSSLCNIDVWLKLCVPAQDIRYYF
jgi:hypothetical protein